MIVVSPWSKGGWVCSQVFDHTSMIRFIEQRFGVARSRTSPPWRRAVCGDLTSAFDFATRTDVAAGLPDHGRLRAAGRRPRHPDYVPVPPAVQAMPARSPD